MDDKNAFRELQHSYLMKFRKCSSVDTLERVCERLRDKLSGHVLDAMICASVHRRTQARSTVGQSSASAREFALEGCISPGGPGLVSTLLYR